MAFSADETIVISVYVEPIAKAMVEEKLESIPTLKQQLIMQILNLRPEMKKNKVEILVAKAVGSITITLTDNGSDDEVKRMVVEIIKRLNIMFQ